ncbi:hypothetical protein BD289DRAFT_18806 [Coniella lustricola]|uniref:C2H2-type domain-containing protein n=1 Tax=Coniella lustricola TaxID=2025994 RepID=A0A2T3AJC5_9PEZI|nr:hypothetical protein BD289DRAFT_18806 [Coniella lustricola]
MEERTAVLKTNRTIRSLNQRRRGSHYALQNINKEASLAGSPSSRQSSLAILSTTAPATTAAAIPARFACPFLKANPRQTEPTSICARSTWPNITRLKEHLSRRHAERKISCPRCDATFDGELEQQDHLRSEKLCDITTKHPSSDQPSNTISSQQMARLKKRSKGQHRENEEEKWYEVFSILFPQSKRPDSPCRSSTFTVVISYFFPSDWQM